MTILQRSWYVVGLLPSALVSRGGLFTGDLDHEGSDLNGFIIGWHYWEMLDIFGGSV
jgi:hypothetical protein